MKTLIFATILTILSFPSRAAEDASQVPATQAAYAALEDALGPANVQVLSDRGVVVLSGSKKTRGLMYVQWPLLEVLSSRAEDAQALSALYEKARAGKEFEGDAAALRRLENSKDAGPLTSAVRAAAALLAAQLENIGPPPEGKTLPATPWGRGFWTRAHCDLVSDFRPAAKLFYETLLSGPFKDDQAEAHFLAAQPVAVESLQRDQRSGELSPQTLSALAAYLTEQKRLWDVSQTKDRLAALERTTELRRDLKDLGALSERLASGPDVLRAVRFALKSKGPKPAAAFSGAELHVNLAAGSEPYDVGDEAVVSLAYWIEGLPVKESIEVTESGFLDEGEMGLSALKTTVVRRAGGGPHTVRFSVPLRSAGRKTLRFLLEAADGASASREALIEVSPRYDEAVEALAEAESAAQACRLEEAEKGFDDLEKSLQEAEKPQFRAFLTWLKPRAKRASEQVEQSKTLAELMDGVRLHASKERCDFRSDKARRALALLDGLPPGCDRISLPREGGAPESLRAEIETLLRQTELRRANQDAFRAALERARKSEAACRHEEAAEGYASALALLGSDAEARCGAWESEYTSVRLQDLPRARAGKAIADDAEAKLAEAKDADHAGALAILTPLIARIDTMESRACYQPLRKKAEELALASGLALGPGETSEALPKDDMDEAVKAVSAERERLDRLDAERRERESRSQAPSIRSGGGKESSDKRGKS